MYTQWTYHMLRAFCFRFLCGSQILLRCLLRFLHVFYPAQAAYGAIQLGASRGQIS